MIRLFARWPSVRTITSWSPRAMTSNSCSRLASMFCYVFDTSFSKVRWFPLDLDRSARVVHERAENNVLCVATAPDGRTTAVSTSRGEVHLFSSLSTRASRQAPLLKYLCRVTINSHVGRKRNDVINLSIAQHLINYLLYKDIKMK
jgi:hypothetical protein